MTGNRHSCPVVPQSSRRGLVEGMAYTLLAGVQLLRPALNVRRCGQHLASHHNGSLSGLERSVLYS